MKPEKAIEKLVALQDGNGDTYEAIRMAIEALTAMESCVLTQFGECSYSETGCSDCETKEKIRKAMEKQIPMPVRRTTSTKRCGRCNRQLSRSTNTQPSKRYCPRCGQAIDWGRE